MTDEESDTTTEADQSPDPFQEAFEFFAPEVVVGGPTLHAGVTLGVFERLTDEPMPASEIADELDLDPDYSYRLLRALASMGLLEEDAERRFSLTPVGEPFQADHPMSLREIALNLHGPEAQSSLQHLPDIVEEGGPDGFVREFGASAFEYVEENPDYAERADRGFDTLSKLEMDGISAALDGYDFSQFSHVCDVGGGYGYLLCSLLEAHPHLEGTVLEVPRVVAQEDQLQAPQMGVEDRCDYVAGDMFEEVPAADAYFLKSILHDWSDEECVEILSNIHEAAPPDGRVFIVENILPGPGTSHPSKILDINMMTSTPGRERTQAEYTTLLEQADWEFVEQWDAEEAQKSVIEGRKA